MKKSFEFDGIGNSLQPVWQPFTKRGRSQMTRSKRRKIRKIRKEA
jgi:hypothetical protein